jgi:peptide/nickel transport system ATP-binding protein
VTQETVEGTTAPRPAPSTFLEVRDLKIHFPTDDGLVKAVDGLSFQLEKGQTLGIVGESGSGKSVTSLAIMGLHGRSTADISGQIWLDGTELLAAPPDQVRRLRGRKMAMIFQDPLSSMHPFYKVGDQIIEAYRVHNDVSKRVARKRAIEMLELVGIPQASKRVNDYPHQFSGGMRQRAMIAMSLSCDPDLLIADEPTTALDVTVQAQMLALLAKLQKERGMALVLITHDLGVVAEVAQRVLVMYAGQIVESASADDLFATPRHPYTEALLASLPERNAGRRRLASLPGVVPGAFDRPAGCLLSPRCPYVQPRCRAERPELFAVGASRARCFFPLGAPPIP